MFRDILTFLNTEVYRDVAIFMKILNIEKNNISKIITSKTSISSCEQQSNLTPILITKTHFFFECHASFIEGSIINSKITQKPFVFVN